MVHRFASPGSAPLTMSSPSRSAAQSFGPHAPQASRIRARSAPLTMPSSFRSPRRFAVDFKLRNMRRGGDQRRAIGTGDDGWGRWSSRDGHRPSVGIRRRPRPEPGSSSILMSVRDEASQRGTGVTWTRRPASGRDQRRRRCRRRSGHQCPAVPSLRAGVRGRRRSRRYRR